MLISKEFKFDAAHHLINYKGKCEEVHGHTYRLRVTLSGRPDKDGLIIDFADIKKIVAKYVLSKVDHKDLNTVLENPSAENIAVWIYNQLADKFPADVKLKNVTVWETETSSVTYNGSM